jgi:hypothetical protein
MGERAGSLSIRFLLNSVEMLEDVPRCGSIIMVMGYRWAIGDE